MFVYLILQEKLTFVARISGELKTEQNLLRGCFHTNR